jgi:hypothetical protein
LYRRGGFIAFNKPNLPPPLSLFALNKPSSSSPQEEEASEVTSHTQWGPRVFVISLQRRKFRVLSCLYFNLSYIQVGQRAFAFQLLLNGLQEYFFFFNCKEEIFLLCILT